MGGAMAAFYANDNLDVIDGLFFLGSYPSDSTDLSQSDLEVISIFGEFDYVSDTAEVESKKKYLPENTEYVLIEGGNHSQFGWYGPQDGDGAATISYKEQHEIIVDALDSFIVDRF